mmetsp:Transcript_59817/g.133278  ORF Transcript_59817/g.133278 Transcript_59817/m.133278 type:complete len:106 (-) Transcript_59817:188-505(-)
MERLRVAPAAKCEGGCLGGVTHIAHFVVCEASPPTQTCPRSHMPTEALLTEPGVVCIDITGVLLLALAAECRRPTPVLESVWVLPGRCRPIARARRSGTCGGAGN